MHSHTVRLLKKQKQLLEIELAEQRNLAKAGKRGLHKKEYYIKIAHSWKHICRAIKLLDSVEDDIFNNFDYIEQ